MRTKTPVLLFAALLLEPSPAEAQLSPEILADSHLLRAEQAIREGDPARARTEIDKIILLQKEHELNLSGEFHFRCAKAAASVDLQEQALESVMKYLTAVGREGRHYVEALELMNKAQDAIEGRKDSQVASPGQPLPTQLAVDFGDDDSTLSSQAGAAAPSCEAWNTTKYFETATVQSVKACLAAGGDPNAQNEYNKRTPLHMAALYNKNPAVIDVLLAAGADLHALAAGADILTRHMWQSTPLHSAAENNDNPMVVQALLAAGADLKSRDGYKRTPLHSAAENNDNPMVVQALLAAGGRPEVAG